ncbi:MAG TPA: tyrosine decarboxylase MfnA [Candidatus Acidoferrales bacterium]|nr:tyrosine decarboxylase MfnA [Candidatus Acidoferrales bacterium]
MQQKSTPQKDVLSELKQRQKLDCRYQDGHILCSMCTKPHPAAKKAYQLFFESNLGDQALFPATSQLEQEVITQLSSLTHSPTSTGFIVSGGTEANLLGLLAARNHAQKQQPEVILPESAHFSFNKICGLLNIKPVFAPLDSTYRVKSAEAEKLITRDTVAIVGTAGTAELGAIDPINELSEIAQKHSIHLHVDAAFGGLIIPFLKNPPHFDFKLSGVKSLTVDPHKMGMAAIPAGGILLRNPELLDSIKTETPYLNSKQHYTFVGTRSGASAASAWAVFKTLGFEGYKKTINACINNTQTLTANLKKAGYKLISEPTLNIIAFQTKNPQQLAQKLSQQGWYVSTIPRYKAIRIIVMPHVKRHHVTAFLKVLNGIEKF